MAQTPSHVARATFNTRPRWLEGSRQDDASWRHRAALGNKEWATGTQGPKLGMLVIACVVEPVLLWRAGKGANWRAVEQGLGNHKAEENPQDPNRQELNLKKALIALDGSFVCITHSVV